jgi:hypothetical protein
MQRILSGCCTRATSGQAAAAPSQGYKLTGIAFTTLPAVTIEEFDKLSG